MTMNILPLDQGSDEWLEVRLDHFTASEAPAMMNESKFQSRDALLDLKKGWKKNPVGDFLERLWKDGHRFEAEARPIAELEYGENLPAVVGSQVIDGVLMLASFDGYHSKLDSVVWEHKSWNEVLAENVRNGLLTPHYYWQLEQQLMVSGADYAIFTVSDGTRDKRVSMDYYPVKGRREALIAGWKQFDKELQEHELAPKQEFIPAKKQTKNLFPAIQYRVEEGSLVVSNAKDVLARISDLAHIEMDKELKSEQDYSDQLAMTKATIKARADLKELEKKSTDEFVSYAAFKETLAEIDKVLQKMQSNGEGKLKERKQAVIDGIIKESKAKFAVFLDDIAKKIRPLLPTQLPCFEWPDYEKAIKNKRTPESIRSNVNAEAARVMIDLTAYSELVIRNIELINEASVDYPQLFNDINTLAIKDTEALQAILKLRVREHIDAEEARLKRIEDDRIAKEKAEEDARIAHEEDVKEQERLAAEADAERIAQAEQAQAELIAKGGKKVEAEEVQLDKNNSGSGSLQRLWRDPDPEQADPEVEAEAEMEAAAADDHMENDDDFYPADTETGPDSDLNSGEIEEPDVIGFDVGEGDVSETFYHLPDGAIVRHGDLPDFDRGYIEGMSSFAFEYEGIEVVGGTEAELPIPLEEAIANYLLSLS